MTLYHGTNADFERISLTIGLRYKDFGHGFYATPDRQTAIRMAQKRARLFGGVPTLITFELDEAALTSDLKVKVFPEKACVEWLLFVDANRDRKNTEPIHDYRPPACFRTVTSTNSIISEQSVPCASSAKPTLKPYEPAQSSPDSDLSHRLRPERVGEIRDGGHGLQH